jgi:uncharacterized phage infection (PIP) family protein YhgE
MAKDRPKDAVKELEAALEREKQDRADADDRANRANDRAREADEAYRKLQLALVAAKDDASTAWDETKRMQEKLTALDTEVTALREAADAAAAAAATAAAAPKLPSAAPPAPSSPSKAPSAAPPKKSAPPAAGAAGAGSNEVFAQVEHMLQRIEGLREMLATASIELSQLHADEVALGKKRSRVLTDACALLARAVGATGQAPPPIPSAALEARFSIAPVVDISEVADLIESLRPPRAPKLD